jgi:hypothetical protein
MRSIAILALLSGLAVCRLAAAAPPADCRPAGVAGQAVAPACRPALPSPPLIQRRPGFWALEDAPGENAADPPPVVLRAGGSACARYPLPVVVGGQPLQATIVACPQADGSWEVTQYTPGLPPQVYTAPPPAAAATADAYGYPENYPESYPDWADWPSSTGLVPAIVVARQFHRFRHPFERRFTAHVEHRSGHDVGRGLAHGFGRGGSVAGAGMHR